MHLAVGIERNEKPILATALKRKGSYTSNNEFQGALIVTNARAGPGAIEGLDRRQLPGVRGTA